MEHVLDCFTHTGDCAWIVDLEQIIVFWNQAAQAVFGYSPQEALGQRCYELLEGRDSEGMPFCEAGCATLRRVQRGDCLTGLSLSRRVGCGVVIQAAMTSTTWPSGRQAPTNTCVPEKQRL